MFKDIEVTHKKLRTFGIALFVFLGFVGYSQFKKGNIDHSYWYWGIGFVYGLMSLVLPSLTIPIYRGAIFVAHILGWINTRIILGAIYYVIFTPVSLGMRLFGRDSLDRKFDKNATTYWQTDGLSHSNKERYLKQF